MRTFVMGDIHGSFKALKQCLQRSKFNYRELLAAAWEWQRSNRLDSHEPPFKIKTRLKEIYLGHTSTTNWNVTVPMQGAHIFNLNTVAGGKGKLTIMEVETKKFWQSDLVPTLNHCMTVKI